ncbi:MAG TPA: hypothetical protein VF982_06945, partial [Anaerolineales bacterium]
MDFPNGAQAVGWALPTKFNGLVVGRAHPTRSRTVELEANATGGSSHAKTLRLRTKLIVVCLFQ